MANVYVTIQDSVAVIKDSTGNVISSNNILAAGTSDIVIGDSIVNIKRSDNTNITSMNVLANSNVDYNVADSTLVIKDQYNNVLDTVNIKANTSDEVVLTVSGTGSATVNIYDANNNLLETVTSSSVANVNISNSTLVIKRSNGTIVSTQSILAEGSKDYTVPNSTVAVNRSDSTLISNVSVMANSTGGYNVPDSTVILKDQLNNVITTKTVKANSTTDIVLDDSIYGTIEVVNTADTLLETINVLPGATDEVTIGDTIININSVSFTTTPAETTKNIVVKNVAGDVVGNKVGNEWIVPTGGNMIYGVFYNTYDTLPVLTITSDMVGSYGTLTSNNVGTLTIKKNGNTVTTPFSLAIGDTLLVIRSTDVGDGWYKLV